MAAQRATTRELAAIERRLAKIPEEIAEVNVRIAEHDQRDYLGVAVHMETLASLESKLSDLETRWLELTEQLEQAARTASERGGSLRSNIKNP
jgi:predicted  nucleic acid-binding Zn-ribbon protein